MRAFLRRMRSNAQLSFGVGILLPMLLVWLAGYFLVDLTKARPLSALPDLPPSRDYLLGTDSVGREMLAVIVAGTPLTLQIGLLAGVLGLFIGTMLGFLAGYFDGIPDMIIRTAADIGLTIQALAVLVVIASVINDVLSAHVMALIIAALAWMWPTRTIRSQVLTMREQPYLKVARLSGLNGFEIIIKEMLPNLLPYLAASFVGAVAASVLAAIGLEALGLGPQSEPTLGMTIFWAIYYGAMLRGMWWWWAPPIVVIVLLFIGLFLVASGLDRIANPRI